MPQKRPAQLDSPLLPKIFKYAGKVHVWVYRRTGGRSRSCVAIATDDGGPAHLRIRQPAFDVAVDRVDNVGELRVLLDIVRDHRADRDDAQPGLARRLQRLIDENRCQTASFEVVVNFGVGEDALAVAIGELREPDLLVLDGNGEAVGFGGRPSWARRSCRWS